MDDERERLIADLEGLLHGSVSVDEFRRRHSIVSETGVTYSLLCNIEHYLADFDIRRKDFAYREIQDTELEKLIAALRSDRVGDALKVSFLRPSEPAGHRSADAVPENRPISDEEAVIVTWMLSHASVGGSNPALESTVGGLRVVGRCHCGCASVDFAKNGQAPPARPIADATGKHRRASMLA